MRFELISLRQRAPRLDEPFQLQPLTDVGEYGCFLFRCEGTMPLHRHMDHDELFWPQDHAIFLMDPQGRRRVPPGTVARVPRGWRHGSAAEEAATVLLISRGARSQLLNGHFADSSAAPPEIAAPLALLSGVADNQPLPFLRCDSLQLHVERVAGTGPARRSSQDVLLMPLQGNVGIRCGGIVAVAQERELARIPSGCGWHLFGNAQVLWMSPGLLEAGEP